MAGGGSIRRNGIDLPITASAVVGRDVAWPSLPWFVRGALRVLRVKEFLVLHVAG